MYFRHRRIFLPNEKGNGIGDVIAHVGDLTISGTDDLVDFIDEQLRNEFDVKVSEENESIYLGRWINKVGDEFIEDRDNFDGANTCSGLRLVPDNSEGEIQAITISPGRGM